MFRRVVRMHTRLQVRVLYHVCSINHVCVTRIHFFVCVNFELFKTDKFDYTNAQCTNKIKLTYIVPTFADLLFKVTPKLQRTLASQLLKTVKVHVAGSVHCNELQNDELTLVC